VITECIQVNLKTSLRSRYGFFLLKELKSLSGKGLTVILNYSIRKYKKVFCMKISLNPVLIFAAVITASSSITYPVYANTAEQCPMIAGAYQHPGDNMIIYWNQNGCNISADAPSSGFDHLITGQWTDGHFDYRVSRRNITNGCTTQMYARLYKLDNSRLMSEVYGSDGRCDLPANFTENSVWIRR
jgi:hypothetical protein